MTHAESIELFKSLGVKFTPELKAPEVPMPFEGDYTQEDYAQQMIDEYKAAGVDPADVFAAVLQPRRRALLDRAASRRSARRRSTSTTATTPTGLRPAEPATWSPTWPSSRREGVKIIAPPMWVLLDARRDGRIVPSAYAKAAKAAGLDIITWTLERSGPLHDGGGWYYQSVADAIDNDGDMLEMLDVLAQAGRHPRHLLRLAGDRDLLRQLHGPGVGRRHPVMSQSAEARCRRFGSPPLFRASCCRITSPDCLPTADPESPQQEAGQDRPDAQVAIVTRRAVRGSWSSRLCCGWPRWAR